MDCPKSYKNKLGKKNGSRTEQTIPKEWIVYNEDIFTEKTFDKENELEKLAEKIKKNGNIVATKQLIHTQHMKKRS